MTRAGCRLFVLGLTLTVMGCDETLRDIAGPSPNLEPTFSSIQREIFAATDLAGRRNCTSCHNAAQARFSGNLNLEANVAYAALVGVPSTQRPVLFRIAPGDPDGSYLIHKVTGAPGIFGDRMPRTNGPFLTEGQVLILRRWIQIGAPNN
ncbi:MAG: hypothetical protein ACT4QD_02645 [Acidobacteriota bacterium]